MTRLGEFSPIGPLFTYFGIFQNHIFGYFFHKSVVNLQVILTK
jgi:hypothetical protein